MSDIQSELLKATKQPPQEEEETEQAFLHRLTVAADKLSNATYDSLSKPARQWVDSAIEAVGANKGGEIPSFNGKANGADPDPEAKASAAPKKATKAKKATPAKPAPAEAETPKKEAASKGKKTAAPKKASAKKATKDDQESSRGRPTIFAPEAKIKVLAKKNPFREGSNSAKVFGMYKPGMTVGDFEKLVAKGNWKSTPKMFLRVHRERGFISVG